MSDERLKMPPERDFGFYQRRKHDAWRAVPAPEPALEEPVVDTHAHVHMLPDPAWELARCAANNVAAVGLIVDPSEDGRAPYDQLDAWIRGARGVCEGAAAARPLTVPRTRLAVGVHPHNARLYTAAVERLLLQLAADPRTCAIGEIGLDYHYDLSPREIQRHAFVHQVMLAKDLGLPVALHLRGGQDPQDPADDAHREAFALLSRVGFPEAGVLLHCCSLPPDELRPWVEAGCYIAYGGALTFKKSDDAREGAFLVPADRLLLETDSPYMAPEPMRGAACTPAHVVFTAACLAEVRGIAPGPSRAAFLQQLNANASRLLGL